MGELSTSCYYISMHKLVKPAILLISALILGGCTLKNPFVKKPAGLDINTTPPATVFLNGQDVGLTPYSNKNVTPGVYTIKLVPASTELVVTWETSLDLEPQVTTIINRTLAETETDSYGSILQLVSEPTGKTYLSVISDPDTINLSLDGLPSGFTPATKIETTPGAHQIDLSSPGYQSLTLSVNTVKSYNLIINAKLAADELVLTPPVVSQEGTPSASLPSSTPSPDLGLDVIEKPYVLIKETGTGWLRVRKEPSATAPELGKADVGEKLSYLGETTETGWHKVEFEGEPGWLSGKFVDLVK